MVRWFLIKEPIYSHIVRLFKYQAVTDLGAVLVDLQSCFRTWLTQAKACLSPEFLATSTWELSLGWITVSPFCQPLFWSMPSGCALLVPNAQWHFIHDLCLNSFLGFWKRRRDWSILKANSMSSKPSKSQFSFWYPLGLSAGRWKDLTPYGA